MTDDLDALIDRVLRLDAEADANPVMADSRLEAMWIELADAAPRLARECQRLRERVAELEKKLADRISDAYDELLERDWERD